ncbi:MAG: glycogen/starch/alpha-glucan phosphorylase [Simkaniaceae bacterium]
MFSAKDEFQIDAFIQKIKHYLITTRGRTSEEASDEEFYQAFIWALREEIMINWTATAHSFYKTGARKIYYLSMEYLPGRLSGNNIANIGAVELIQKVLKKMNRKLKNVISQESDMGIGNGGLGRLASCFLDSLATQQYPALGYGLRYQYGIFEQELWCGVQVERPDCWLLIENPWEFRRDGHAAAVQFAGTPIASTNSHGNEVFGIVDCEEIRALPFDYPIIGYNKTGDFSVLTLRLWSTKESPRNFQLQRYNAGHIGEAGENTSLTDVLYPNDNHETGKRIRLKQEFLLVAASLEDIFFQYFRSYPDISSFADKVRIQINDTHPALVVAELMHRLTKDYDIEWGEAWDITRTCCSYTNHTVMREALEEWNEKRVDYLLPRQYRIIQKINEHCLNEVRKKYPDDEQKVRRMSIFGSGQIRMAHLAIFGSHKLNGVAKLHTELLKKSVFRDFYEMAPEKFINVTNGVTQRRWLLYCNPRLSKFITDRIGEGWITNFQEMEKLHEFASDQKSREEFLEIKKLNKEDFLPLLKQQIQKHSTSEKNMHAASLGVDAMFDVQIKRIHEYKRQLMNALHALILYQEYKNNPPQDPVKRLIIFGGKAAPGYEMAKHIIRFIYCLSRKINNDPDLDHILKIVFIENYNVSKAEVIIPATDLSQQISCAGLEASGTGNMKLAMNGALTIGTDDGANIEMRESIGDQWWPFLFGAGAEENIRLRKEHAYDSAKLLRENPKIQNAIESLRDGSLVENEAEHNALTAITNSLLEAPYGHIPDRFFVLRDLESYYQTQKKAEQIFRDPHKWAEFAIHNMAGMHCFSTDGSINEYAENIWEIKPCPPLKEELDKVRQEYHEHDRCRIIQAAS